MVGGGCEGRGVRGSRPHISLFLLLSFFFSSCFFVVVFLVCVCGGGEGGGGGQIFVGKMPVCPKRRDDHEIFSVWSMSPLRNGSHTAVWLLSCLISGWSWFLNLCCCCLLVFFCFVFSSNTLGGSEFYRCTTLGKKKFLRNLNMRRFRHLPLPVLKTRTH